jgi:hypothetical protein
MGGAEFAQQGGSVDLIIQLRRLELLDRTLDRTQCREMRSGCLGIEGAQPGILIDSAGSAAGYRIEVVLEIQIRAAEIIDLTQEILRSR